MRNIETGQIKSFRFWSVTVQATVVKITRTTVIAHSRQETVLFGTDTRVQPRWESRFFTFGGSGPAIAAHGSLDLKQENQRKSKIVSSWLWTVSVTYFGWVWSCKLKVQSSTLNQRTLRHRAVFIFGGSGPAITAHGSLDFKQENQIQIPDFEALQRREHLWVWICALYKSTHII
jgi:hypothetical protein